MKYLISLSLGFLFFLFSFHCKAQKFSILAIPDTQHYKDVAAEEDNFYAQTKWIRDNRDVLNIAFITGVGGYNSKWK